MRCNAAAISFNSKGRFHSTFHKSVTGNSPGSFTKRLIKRQLYQRQPAQTKRKCKKRLFEKKRSIVSSDENYGPNVDHALDIDSPEYETLKRQYLEELDKTDE